MFRLCGFRWSPHFVCLALLLASAGVGLRAEDWPEWRGKGRTGVWNDTGLVDKLPEGGPPVTWRTPLNGGYAGPSVADARVFVTDGRRVKGNAVIERAVALDEKTGQVLWTREWNTNYGGLQPVYAVGPRATPTVDGSRVYFLGAMGALLALDVKTGDVLWQKDYVRDFNALMPPWGITGAPLVDGDRLICIVGGEPNAKVVAFNKLTGEEIWRALSSDWEPGYGQPFMTEAAGAQQLIIFHPRAVSALEPATGRVFWEISHPVELGLTIPTPVRSGPYMFITAQYGGEMMLKLDEGKPGASVVWSNDAQNAKMNSVISTPVIQGDYVYGLEHYGELVCLELTTGKEVWKNSQVLQERAYHGTAFFVRNGDRYFINNDRGELIIATLSPHGYNEISRATVMEPTHPYVRRRQFPTVLWSHAAYANKHMFLRNDKEIVRFSLEKKP